MTVKDSIAKVLLWGYIKVKDLYVTLGGVGHGVHVCGLAPWELPDPGPWMGVCSPRICPCYEECVDLGQLIVFYDEWVAPIG